MKIKHKIFGLTKIDVKSKMLVSKSKIFGVKNAKDLIKTERKFLCWKMDAVIPRTKMP